MRKRRSLPFNMSSRRASDLPDVPASSKTRKNDEDRALLTFAAASGDIGRAFSRLPAYPRIA